MNKKAISITNLCIDVKFKTSRDSYRTCIVDVVVYNSEGNYKSEYTYPFLIDTGAIITILNLSFNSFIAISKPPQIDEIEIQYGAGKIKKCPVYELRFMIKGHSYPVKAAHDDTLGLTSLIGMHGFINNLFSLVVSKEETKLISLWK